MVKLLNYYKNLLFILIFVVILSVFGLGLIFADEIQTLQEQIENAENELRTKEQILSQTSQYIDQILNGSQSLDQKIVSLDEEIFRLDEDYVVAKENFEAKESEYNKLVEKYNSDQDDLKAVVSSLYKSKSISLVEQTMSGDELSDVLRSYAYRSYIYNNMSSDLKSLKKEISELEVVKKRLEIEKGVLESQLSALQESKGALADEKAKLQQQLYAQTAYQSQLSGDINSLSSQIDTMSADLQNAIRAKAGSGGGGSGGGNSSGGSSPQPVSGDPGLYDIYIGCQIEGGQYVDCDLLSENTPGPIRVLSSSPDNVFEIELSRQYRGVLEFRADSNVYLINELPFELYLRGIGEMPSSWPAESLKAQAVAARTYAAQNWNKRLNDKYNLRSDTYDQNYVGYGKELDGGYGQYWIGAVDATTAEVITYGGEPIGAYYHSTCGGHTLASEEVWVSALPYTRAKSDWYESNGTWRSYDEASPWSYKKWGEGSIDNTQMVDLLNASLYLSADVNSPTRQSNIVNMSPAEIEAELGAGNRIQDIVGSLSNVQSVYNNGSTAITPDARYTQSVLISGSAGSININRDAFWIVYNGRSPGTLTLYWSNFWTSVNEGGSWNFYSRGYPHRVGMCQYGAYGRAAAGQSYTDILSHYYDGTEIGVFAAPSEFRVGLTNMSDGDIFIRNNVGGDYNVYSNGNNVGLIDASTTLRVVKK